MSSLHNKCIMDRELLLQDDSFTSLDASSDLIGHARGDITPEPVTEAGFLESLAAGVVITSTPGSERALGGVRIKKKELRTLMEVSFEEILKF